MKQDINTIWKNLAANKQNTAFFHAQYCILRSINAKAEDKLAVAKHLLRKAFTPVSKTTKLANGRIPFDIIADQFNAYRWSGKHAKVLGIPMDEVLDESEQELYHSIAQSLRKTGGLVRHYSYFFTRQDIFEEYQLVQTAHAALELGRNLTKEQAKDLHFTCCGVRDMNELESVERVLQAIKVPYVVFREPDIGNQKTSIGVYPIEEHKRGILRNYNLLRFEKPETVSVRGIEVDVKEFDKV